MAGIKKIKTSEKKTKKAKVSISQPEEALPVDPVVKEEEPTSQEQVQDIPKGWIKITSNQVVVAEKEGKLIGFDSSKMIALIKE